MSKKDKLIDDLLLLLLQEKGKVNQALIDGEFEKLQLLQNKAFYTAKTIRKLL